MKSTTEKHLEGAAKAFDAVTDLRYFDRGEILTAYMYTKYLVNLADDEGVEIRGESFKLGEPMSLLVVKATVQGAPYVCFVSGLSRLACYKIFLRRLQEGTVEWRPDQYA